MRRVPSPIASRLVSAVCVAAPHLFTGACFVNVANNSFFATKNEAACGRAKAGPGD